MSTKTKEQGKTQETKSASRQYCKSGHDTFVCGRDSQGHCKDCRAGRSQTLKPTLDFKGLYNKEHHPFSFDDYVQLYMDQGKKCRICDTEGKHYPDGLQPDSNKQNEVVSLLCPPCSSLATYLKGKTQLLATVVQYLKLYQ